MSASSTLKDLTGQTFGRLEVLHRADNHVSKKGVARPAWLCRCSCGKEVVVIGSNLTRGQTRSCGCLAREELAMRRVSHGDCTNGTSSRLYGIWRGIKKRCLNTSDSHYPQYGGRGISMCDEWKSYLAFKEWSLNNGYTDCLTIDRIDTDGSYCPSNCRWATPLVQQNNRRSCVYITHDGEKHTLKEWSRITGINYQTLYQRYKLGWDVDKMLSK